MKLMGRSMKKILLGVLCTASLSVADGFDQGAKNGLRYGPNLSVGIMGNTPIVWGQWLPQLVGDAHYTWLEPIGDLNYGSKLENNPTYLRMDFSIDASPFYCGYLAGLGFRPFKTNPQFEVNFTYESYLYMMSNLEMVTVDVQGEGRIAETWNADYVVDNVWMDDSGDWDYVQMFDMSVSLEYAFTGRSVVGVSLHYILSDIITDFDGKSYDYKRNIPVFSRDFLVEFNSYGRFIFNKNWACVFESVYYRTGYLRHGSTVEKESLGYGLVKAGPHFSWKDGLHNVTFELGAWKRYRDRFYDGSLAQEFLVQLEYQGYFSLPTHRNLAE